MVERIKEVFGVGNPYISIPEVDKILSDNPDDAPVQILEEAYNEFFADPGSKDFDPTLFRFLLGRLANVKSAAPLMYEFTQHLVHHPEETETVLAYVEQLDQQGAAENDIVNFLESGDSVYPYQIYQVMNWLGRVLIAPSDHTIAVARRMAFDRTQPSYVRAVSQKMLGDHGTVADLERLQGLYAEAGSPLAQSELICSLHRMEAGRRNAILARMEQDGPLQQRAVRLVRAGRIGGG